MDLEEMDSSHENLIVEDNSKDSSERIPLSDMTEMLCHSANTSTKTPACRRENRKRSLEDDELPDTNTTPPDSMRLPPDHVCTQQTPGVFKYRRRLSNQPPIDYFEVYKIPIEVLRIVFKYLNKKDMCNAMQTCQLFYSAGSTCDNWDFIDLHNRHIHDTKLTTILDRKVHVCRMSDAKISATENVPMTLPRNPDDTVSYYSLTHLDMGRATFGRIEALVNILAGCIHLQGLCLELMNFGERAEEIGGYIGQNTNLKYLDLSLTRGLTPATVKSIVTGCKKLSELNLAWSNLDVTSVKVLVKTLPLTLKRINLSGTQNKTAIDDYDVHLLATKCPYLEEVDLSDNLSLTEKTISHLLELPLQCLSLNRCYNIDPQTYLACEDIYSLNVIGSLTNSGELSLRQMLRGTRVNEDIINHIAKPTIPPAVSSIWLHRTRDIY